MVYGILDCSYSQLDNSDNIIIGLVEGLGVTAQDDGSVCLIE